MLTKAARKEGRVFDTTNMRKEWMKACAACGLGEIIELPAKKYDPRYKGLTLHDLRRSAIRNLVTIAGIAECIAMKITGHKNRNVFDRYHIVNTAEMQGAMQAWEIAAKSSAPKCWVYFG
jgi:integrase